MIVTNKDLQGLPSREALAAALRELFPHLSPDDTALSPIIGGRQAALAKLAAVQPQAYERSRNYLSGQVTQLSAYLRHGVLSLAEVRDHALAQVAKPDYAGKLINEYAWRDYWQRLYAQLGEGIWQDRETYKTGYRAQDYAADLPFDVPAGTTTLVCMDSLAQQLEQTGWLHNHARMWFAAYLVHWRKIRWQAGARWFLSHLVDGDPASNNLSWQWVASTFASKPYFFNRENLERYTASVYCKKCPHAGAGTCPFDDSYEALEQTLFPRLNDGAAQTTMPAPPARFAKSDEQKPSAKATGKPLIWVHTDSLNATLMDSQKDAPAVFLWDSKWLTDARITLKRIVFLAESLAELPGTIELRSGDPATELLAAARVAGADYILAQRTPDPRLLAAAQTLGRTMPVVWVDPPPFVESSRAFDLKRFSRYWQRAQASAMQPTR